VTSNSAQTNRAYGTMLTDDYFCRYRVYMSSGSPRVRVQYYPKGCGTGSCTGNFYFGIDGTQLFCSGSDCISG